MFGVQPIDCETSRNSLPGNNSDLEGAASKQSHGLVRPCNMFANKIVASGKVPTGALTDD